jgi:hypothetical protein
MLWDPCIVWYIASKLSPGVSLSRLEDRLLMQKIGYIVQEILGQKLGYRFSWYSYGPYSRALSRDLHSYEELCVSSYDKDDEMSLINILDRFTEIYVKAQMLCPSESMARILEIVASLHMLSANTYPPSTDPVGDLTRIKPYISRTCAEQIFSMLREIGVIKTIEKGVSSDSA